MWVVTILLAVAVMILVVQLSYKNYCIDDLETSRNRLIRMQADEVLTLLAELKGFMNDNYEPASRDTLVRNAINESIEKYSAQKRRLDREQ